MRPSTTEGSPALGSTEIGIGLRWERYRRCSLISAGPVAQLRPIDVGAERRQRGQGGPDLGAEQHAAGGFDGDLHLQRDLAAGVGHGPAAADDGGLGLEEVLDRLDDEQVDPALEQPGGGLLVAVALAGEGDLPEGGDLGARAEGTRHPGTAGGRPGRPDRVTGEARRCGRQLAGPRGEPVFGQHPGERPEAVGFDHVAADVEEGPVQVGDHVRPGVHQHLVAALEGHAAEIVGTEVSQLQVGPDGSVEDHHALAHRFQVGTHINPGGGCSSH